MNKYYLVPVVVRTINYEGQPFFKILESMDEVLYRRELARVELQYGGDLPEDGFSKDIMAIVKEHNRVTSKMFKERGVPEKVVIVRDSDKIYELVTEKEVTVGNPFFLEAFEIDPEEVVDVFYENPNYVDAVNNFLGGYEKKEAVQKRKSSNK